MNDLTAHMKSVVRSGLAAIAIALAVWAALPAYRELAAGFVLGVAVSLVNGYLLAFKINQITQNVVENAKKRVGLGYVSRVCMALIAVMIALKTPGIHLVTTLIGLFYVQLVTLLMGIYLFIWKKH